MRAAMEYACLVIILFHIWKQRNQSRMLKTQIIEEKVLKRSIEMVEIGYEEGKFKRKHKTADEQRALHHWNTLLMLIHARNDGGLETTNCQAIR